MCDDGTQRSQKKEIVQAKHACPPKQELASICERETSPPERSSRMHLCGSCLPRFFGGGFVVSGEYFGIIYLAPLYIEMVNTLVLPVPKYNSQISIPPHSNTSFFVNVPPDIYRRQKRKGGWEGGPAIVLPNVFECRVSSGDRDAPSPCNAHPGPSHTPRQTEHGKEGQGEKRGVGREGGREGGLAQRILPSRGNTPCLTLRSFLSPPFCPPPFLLLPLAPPSFASSLPPSLLPSLLPCLAVRNPPRTN